MKEKKARRKTIGRLEMCEDILQELMEDIEVTYYLSDVREKMKQKTNNIIRQMQKIQSFFKKISK